MSALITTPFPFSLGREELCESFFVATPGRILSLISVIDLLLPLDPIQIRLVGSTALALMQEDPRASVEGMLPTSDIDIHAVVMDLDSVPAKQPLLMLPPRNGADILAAKIHIGGYAVSLHMYSIDTFRKMSGLKRACFTMSRNTPKNQTFTCPGVRRAAEIHWQSMESEGAYVVDIVQEPLAGGSLHIYPYPYVALIGIDFLPCPAVHEARLALLTGMIDQASREGCPDGEAFAAMFSYSTRENPPLLRRALADSFSERTKT